jgi:TPR repeat protein
MIRVKMIKTIALVIIGTLVWFKMGICIAKDEPHLKALNITYEMIAEAYQYGYEHGECPDKIVRKKNLEIICKEGVKDKAIAKPPNLHQASFVYCEHLAMIAFKERKYDEMYMWWEIAAEAGRTDAQFFLGGMLKDGLGGRRDCQKAVKWLQKAANSGHGQAQYQLGLMYYYGNCVAQDIQKAVDLNDKAMENNVAEAYTHMGTMISEKKIVEAYVYWRIASEMGDKHATELLEKHNFTPEQRAEGEKKFEELIKMLEAQQ